MNTMTLDSHVAILLYALFSSPNHIAGRNRNHSVHVQQNALFAKVHELQKTDPHPDKFHTTLIGALPPECRTLVKRGRISTMNILHRLKLHSLLPSWRRMRSRPMPTSLGRVVTQSNNRCSRYPHPRMSTRRVCKLPGHHTWSRTKTIKLPFNVPRCPCRCLAVSNLVTSRTCQ